MISDNDNNNNNNKYSVDKVLRFKDCLLSSACIGIVETKDDIGKDQKLSRLLKTWENTTPYEVQR